MSKCPNCGASLGCGCQKRTLPDGKQGCVNCLNKTKTVTPKNPKSLSVWGKERYKTL